jgi:hypothetical protein
MAILDNVLIDSSRNKIGNIVTYWLKGQQIARAYNPSPYDPKTPAQVAQRNKIANTVLGYQTAKDWLINAFELRNLNETIYNAFVRLTARLMPDYKISFGIEVLSSLFNNLVGYTSYVQITSCLKDDSAYIVYFDAAGHLWNQNIRLSILSFEDFQDTQIITNYPLSEAEFLQGYTEIINLAGHSRCPCSYIYSPENLRCSNLCFWS